MNFLSQPADAISSNRAVCLAAIAIGCITITRLTRQKSQLPLPPGPKALPIIGNLLDVPPTNAWKTFSEWSVKWGDLMSIKILDQPIIIVSSVKVVEDLLEKRSLKYSNRPVLTFIGEIVGWSNAIALLQYGHRFREFRKYMNRLIGTKAAMEKFDSLMEHETAKFLARVMADPNSFSQQIRKTAGAFILMLAYGYPVRPERDPLVDLVETAVHQFGQGTDPGAFLIDVIPALQYVPAWFPGAGWKRMGERFKQTLANMTDVPYRFVQEQMAAGTAIPSYTSELLSRKDLDAEAEWNIKWSAASLYAGGGDTTVSFLRTFFLAMQLYPEVQRKAQEELDRVVGQDRLPRIADRPNLPYIEAVIKELLRWNPVAPLGVPHASAEDDMYEGYFIPKGATVIVNIWHILHDSSVYPDPMEFIPERYLGENPQKDPTPIAFGFGRRACPGINMAHSSVFIEITMTLSTFNISKYVDESGNVIEPEIHYSDGAVSHPKPFKCDIKPRSEKAIAVISAIEL
ncbi:cytochrome P450 [Thelephora ganbajun]|uniref:Cytochrome P450 n=1 Tax=Thelephora ganbajun TaxID=370292 RepID=A0ACB6ZCL5_THEGA|nr:cytochrome P450 [Thelephora ganbajun]